MLVHKQENTVGEVINLVIPELTLNDAILIFREGFGKTITKNYTNLVDDQKASADISKGKRKF